MIAGKNESVRVKGLLFHVQTEYHDAPDVDYIETLIFQGGHIVLSHRFERRKNLSDPPDEQALAIDLVRIHRMVVEKLRKSRSGGKISALDDSERSIRDDRLLRKCAIRLHRTIGTSPGEDLWERLRSIVNTMAWVAGHQAVQALRRDDLDRLLRYREEAIQLIREPEPDKEDGCDLWRRLAASASELARVNDRRTLIQHDIRLCRHVLRDVAGASADRRLSEAQQEELRQVWGRDGRLDALLDQPASLEVGVVRDELERILLQLEGSSGGDDSMAA